MNICELLENNTQQQQLHYDDESEKLIKEKLTLAEESGAASVAESDSASELGVDKILPKTDESAVSLPSVDASSLNSAHSNQASSDEAGESSSTSQSEFNYYLIEQLKNEPNDNHNSTTNQGNDHEAGNQDHSPYFNNSASNEETDYNNHQLNEYKNIEEEAENHLVSLLSDQDNSNENNSANDYGLGSSTQSIEDEQSFGPFEKLCKLCDDPTPMNIETAPKYLVGALEFSTSQDDYVRVFGYLRKYCCYSDVLLRSYWLEQIQSVMQYIHQESENITIEFTNGFSMTDEIIALVGELIREQTYQVKKCAISSILYLVEKRLIDNKQIEEKIIPNLLFLLNENNDDFHVDCISIFGKLAPLVGQKITTEHILKPFCSLCSSAVFHTRKACAGNMAEIANAVSPQDVERELLPNFCELMKDQVWAIRKICADTFATFASKCTRKTRIEVLTPCFTKLLDDHSRWVKLSAYKMLGSFIVTFLNEKNEPEASTEKETTDTNASAEYSDFMYWRNSLPKLDVESASATSSLEKSPAPSTVKEPPSTYGNTNISIYSSSGSLNIYSQLQQEHQEQLEQKAFDINELSESLKQDIVPPILLSYFITMVDPNSQNSLDAEMNYNCAYNFPAIALTLGQTNWKYLSNLYKRLAEDVSWKVRQTLAYSIHELAQILGTEYTQTDLVPIFESYIKDVDEVRIGIVSNMSKFLTLLNDEHRRAFLPNLICFLKMDNQRNWRFRNELGLQIIEFCKLFSADSIAEYIQPLVFQLALDKIAEVRLTGIKALSEILKQFKINNSLEHRKNFVGDVVRTFATNSKWSFRQLYAYLCDTILAEDSDFSLEAFSNDFMPKLLAFRDDKVPNVRITLAHVFATHIVNKEFFRSGKCSVKNELIVTLHALKQDTDTDVKSQFHEPTDMTQETSTNENTDLHGDEEEDDSDDDEVDETKPQNNPNNKSQLKIVNFESEELETDQCY